MHPDFYNSDAFSLVTLTAVINDEEHIPGRAGELVFGGIGEGVSTTSVDFELNTETLGLIPTSARGGPAPLNTQDKRVLKTVGIPHIKLEEPISAAQIQNIRELGSMDTLRGARSVVDGQMRKQSRRHDLTLEHFRLGALSGIILDSDTTEILDLFDFFGITEAVFDFDAVFQPADSQAATLMKVRRKCNDIVRHMKRNIGGAWNSGARVWSFVGDNFMDKLVETIGDTNKGYEAAERKLGDSYVNGVLEWGGIFFENYQGTNDASKTSSGAVGIDPDEARFFITGVPGLYQESYAPGDFMETVNTLGLPRYAKVAPTDNMNRSVTLHTQQNPLPMCLKPATLVKGTSTASTEDLAS
jgi:hypothetical protein